MDTKHFADSFLKYHWFYKHDSLPQDAMQQIIQHCLTLQESIVALRQHIHTSIWHEHELDAYRRPNCIACQITWSCKNLTLQICSKVTAIVMDFFDEPDHHTDLELAVRLSAWSTFQVALVMNDLDTDRSHLDAYARYRLEEVYAQSLVQKDLEEAENKPRTSDLEKRYLEKVFVSVHSALLDELQQWHNVHPDLPLTTFPASSAPTLLQVSTDAPQWPGAHEIPPEHAAIQVMLPLYEWHLLAMLLAESVVHFSYCTMASGRPASPPAWLPRHQHRWDEQSIVQTAPVWKGLISILNGLRKHFAAHICDDVDLASYVPDQAMRCELLKRFSVLNGSPESYQEDYEAGRTSLIESFARLAWYFARRIEAQLSNQSATPSQDPAR